MVVLEAEFHTAIVPILPEDDSVVSQDTENFIIYKVKTEYRESTKSRSLIAYKSYPQSTGHSFLHRNDFYSQCSSSSAETWHFLCSKQHRFIDCLLAQYSSTTSDNSFAVSYLIDSCGFPPDKAISASKSLKFKTPDRADSVIAFFKHQGFKETQISNLVRKSPSVLTYHPQKNFLPKFNFLSSTGLLDSDIYKVFTTRPKFLSRSLKNYIEPNYNSLRDFLQSNDRAVIAIRIPNMQILRDVGVPASKMLYVLSNCPRTFLVTTDLFKETVEEVVEMGFDPLKTSFMLAVHAIRSMSKSVWDRKMETYEKWGSSKSQILQAFRTSPWCMTKSVDKIDKVMDFLVNKMGLETSVIAK